MAMMHDESAGFFTAVDSSTVEKCGLMRRSNLMRRSCFLKLTGESLTNSHFWRQIRNLQNKNPAAGDSGSRIRNVPAENCPTQMAIRQGSGLRNRTWAMHDVGMNLRSHSIGTQSITTGAHSTCISLLFLLGNQPPMWGWAVGVCPSAISAGLVL
jgi:hypothetical protein